VRIPADGYLLTNFIPLQSFGVLFVHEYLIFIKLFFTSCIGSVAQGFGLSKTPLGMAAF
jgi:hypothetical protein